MLRTTIAASVLLAHNAWAVPQFGNGNSGSADFLRFGCSQLVVERTDPLVTPGMLPSPHMHQVVGGNSFNITMDPETIDPPKTSTCTSCSYTEDTSNYWTASIYFKSPENGTYKRVPQMANGRLNNTLLEQDGGLTVYYMRPFSGTKTMKMTAMRPVRNDVSPSSPKELTLRRASACSLEIPRSAQRTVRLHSLSATVVSRRASESRVAVVHPAIAMTLPSSRTSPAREESALRSFFHLAGMV